VISSRSNIGFIHARGFTCFALFLALLGMVQQATSQQAKQDMLPLEAVVRELSAEAEAMLKVKDVPRGKPDYASRCAHDVPMDQISDAIMMRLHREPLIDAYIRWQLTSFDPPLPLMDERAFAKFMDSAPPMIENPQANAAMLELFERADKAGVLRDRDLERLRAAWLDLEQRTKVAELLNRPAIEFRDFIDDKLGETGSLPRLWLIERCAATIKAGWSTRSIKTRITRSFTAAATDATITPEQRRLIVLQTHKLAEMKQRSVSDVTFMANGSVNVSFSTAGVTENDVEKWTNRLAGVP